jgi:hypothetical protein
MGVAVFGALATSSSPYNTILGLIIGLPCGIYFGTRWGFHAQAVLVEEVSTTNALRRSRELVTGAWWRVFGILSALLVLAIIIELVLVTSPQHRPEDAAQDLRAGSGARHPAALLRRGRALQAVRIVRDRRPPLRCG